MELIAVSDEHKPERGSDVEAFIKSWRDRYPRDCYQSVALDDMLDDYRLHADTGMPLTMDVTDDAR